MQAAGRQSAYGHSIMMMMIMMMIIIIILLIQKSNFETSKLLSHSFSRSEFFLREAIHELNHLKSVKRLRYIES